MVLDFSSEFGQGHFRMVCLPSIEILCEAFDRISDFLMIMMSWFSMIFKKNKIIQRETLIHQIVGFIILMELF